MSELEGGGPVVASEGVSGALSAPVGVDGAGDRPPPREQRYRIERNEARLERDALAQRVESLLSREAERIASKRLAEPADLFSLTGKSVRDFVGEDGELDGELILSTANDLLGVRPGLARNAPAVDPTQGHGFQGGKSAPSLSDLLKF